VEFFRTCPIFGISILFGLFFFLLWGVNVVYSNDTSLFFALIGFAIIITGLILQVLYSK